MQIYFTYLHEMHLSNLTISITQIYLVYLLFHHWAAIAQWYIWTAGQQVKQLILHLGHDSYQHSSYLPRLSPDRYILTVLVLKPIHSLLFYNFMVKYFSFSAFRINICWIVPCPWYHTAAGVGSTGLYMVLYTQT